MYIWFFYPNSKYISDIISVIIIPMFPSYPKAQNNFIFTVTQEVNFVYREDTSQILSLPTKRKNKQTNKQRSVRQTNTKEPPSSIPQQEDHVYGQLHAKEDPDCSLFLFSTFLLTMNLKLQFCDLGLPWHSCFNFLKNLFETPIEGVYEVRKQ